MIKKADPKLFHQEQRQTNPKYRTVDEGAFAPYVSEWRYGEWMLDALPVSVLQRYLKEHADDLPADAKEKYKAVM